MAAPSTRCRHRVRAWSAVAAAVGLGLVASACDLPRLGAPDPASDEGRTVASLWSGFLLAAAAVTLLIWVLLAWVLIRYRRKGREDEIPSQEGYHVPLEVIYTVIPVLIVIVLFTISFRAERKLNAVEAHPAVRVEVVGFQWSWEFRYQGEGITVTAPPGERPQLVLPVGEATNLHLVAGDVAHSFWVPDFLAKRDLIPGVDNTITVRPNRVGTYVGRCAEFCGLDHWQMSFEVKVVSQADFERWLTEHRTGTGS